CRLSHQRLSLDLLRARRCRDRGEHERGRTLPLAVPRRDLLDVPHGISAQELMPGGAALLVNPGSAKPSLPQGARDRLATLATTDLKKQQRQSFSRSRISLPGLK